MTGLNADGSCAVTRGMTSTVAADHALPVSAYPLSEKVIIVPFVKNFFGSPASGDWRYSVSIPNVRIASTELSMTNALGAGPAAANTYTNTIDSGLRTMAGGQFSFQVSGYLAIQTNAAPLIVVDANRSVRDIFGIVGTAPTGAGIILHINRNGAAYATVEFNAGATTSRVVSGFGMPALQAGDQLSMNIAGVGTTVPGSDLTLILRL